MPHGSESAKWRDLLEKTFILRSLLIAKARFQVVDEVAYERIRSELQENSELWSQLPAFVRDLEGLEDFWQFIQGRLGSRHERRLYIEQEFRRAVEWLESIANPSAAEVQEVSQHASTLEERVALLLETTTYRVSRDVSAEGLQIDFLVQLDDERRVYLELKEWAKTSENSKRAAEQVSYYKKAFGGGQVLVVVPDSGVSWNEPYVVPESRLLDALRKIEYSTPATKHLAGGGRLSTRVEVTSTKVETGKPHIFAAMPFAPEYDDVYFVAMAPAASAVGADCRRVDKEEFVGSIKSRIDELIESAVAVIADVTGNRPNVMFEVGFASGIGKPIVYISSDDAARLPFDISHQNVIFYKPGATHLLKGQLETRLGGLTIFKQKK